MPKPVGGSQLAQDVFEKLGEQGQDVAKGLQDLLSGDATSGPTNEGDAGIEQLSNQQDPAQQLKQAANQGMTPQQLAQKQAEEQQAAQFHRNKIQEWEEQYKGMKQQEEKEKQQKEEEEKAAEQQKIVQLQEEEARAATLQGSSKPKQGRGTAFLPASAKQNMGTGELSKRPTN